MFFAPLELDLDAHSLPENVLLLILLIDLPTEVRIQSRATLFHRSEQEIPTPKQANKVRSTFQKKKRERQREREDDISKNRAPLRL